MQQILQHSTTEINALRHLNNNASVDKPSDFELAKRRPYQQERERYELVDSICRKYKYKQNRRALLNALIKYSDINFVCKKGIESLTDEVGCSESTTKRGVARFFADGLIDREPRPCIGNPSDNETTLTTLLFLKHKFSNGEVKMTSSIKDLNLNNKNIINTNYKEDVSVFDNTEKRIEKPAIQGEEREDKSKRVNLSRLNGTDPDAEVIRICLLYMLSEPQTRDVVMRMRNRKGMIHPAKYLSSLVQGVANHGWKVTSPTDKQKPSASELAKQDYDEMQQQFRARAQHEIEMTRQSLQKKVGKVEELPQPSGLESIIAECLRRANVERA